MARTRDHRPGGIGLARSASVQPTRATTFTGSDRAVDHSVEICPRSGVEATQQGRGPAGVGRSKTTRSKTLSGQTVGNGRLACLWADRRRRVADTHDRHRAALRAVGSTRPRVTAASPHSRLLNTPRARNLTSRARLEPPTPPMSGHIVTPSSRAICGSRRRLVMRPEPHCLWPLNQSRSASRPALGSTS